MTKEGLMINPVMLKVHLPIVIIGCACILYLTLNSGYSFLLGGGTAFLFELIYIVFIQERIEQQKTWIPIRT